MRDSPDPRAGIKTGWGGADHREVGDQRRDSTPEVRGGGNVAAAGAAGPGPAFPELVFGLVRPLGTDTTAVLDELRTQLSPGNYRVEHFTLSSLLPSHPDPYSADRCIRLMNEGDEARRAHGERDRSAHGGEVMALRAIREIAERRRLLQQRGRDRIAWVLDGLMHPDEVRVLREVYGPRLFVVSCGSPQDQRVEALAHRLCRESGMPGHEAEQIALRLIHRNAGLDVRPPPCSDDPSVPLAARPATPRAAGPAPVRRPDDVHRVAVEKAFELGDAFVRCDEPGTARRVVARLVQCVLSHPFHTPTLDELGMAVAYQASLATASLARRVGAALLKDEQILAIGCNEVPKTGGGVFHAESDPDEREFVLGSDPSDQIRVEIFADTLRRLNDVFELRLRPSPSGPPPDGAGGTATGAAGGTTGTGPGERGGPALGFREILDTALGSADVLKGKIFDVIEYGRAAHAEIVAITSAARRGIPVQDATLYCTTMPCHECTRAIVAAGIRRVVYVEPYAKSRGTVLLAHAVTDERRDGDRPGRIRMELFSGIAHHRFADLFSWVDRKEDARRPDPTAASGPATEDAPAGPGAERGAAPGRPRDGDSGPRRSGGRAVRWDPETSGVRPSLYSRTFREEEDADRQRREEAAVRMLTGSEGRHPR